MRFATRLLLASLLLTGVAGADPSNLRVTSVRAWAPYDMPRQVTIEVKVTNTGSQTDYNSVVDVTLTPLNPPDMQQTAPVTAFSPALLQAEVGPLAPGQTRTLQLLTPYAASEDFSIQSGQFPGQMGDETRQVRYSVDLE